MADQFIKDAWYVAAGAGEVGGRPLGRTICGEPVVLFRTSGGNVAAISDFCPHRKYPLSRGEVVRGQIQCGYHGLRFDGEGRCVHIPSQEAIPEHGLNARRYPVVERHGLIFLWIGDDGAADETRLPDWSWNTDPEWTAVYGYHYVKTSYLLLIDNLQDLSHLPFVHNVTFGGAGFAENPISVEIVDEVVKSRREIPGGPQSVLVRATGRFDHDGPIDRWQTSEFYLPSYVLVLLGAGEVGGEVTPHHAVINSVTPETQTTSHYFWSVARRFGLRDDAVSDLFRDITHRAFDEDQLVLEAQQQAILEDRSGNPLAAVQADRAGLAARRLIASRLRTAHLAAAE